MIAWLERPRWIAAAATAVLVLFVLALGFEGWALLRAGASPLRVACVAIARAPLFLYLWALWEVRRAMSAIARGDAAERLIPRVLARVGWALAWGAGVRVVAGPLALRAVRGVGPYLYFDTAAMTLGVVGLLLVLLARLLARAAAMRAELDAII